MSNAETVRNCSTLTPSLKKDIIEASQQYRERSFSYSTNNKEAYLSVETQLVYVNQLQIRRSSREHCENDDDQELELYENLESSFRSSSDDSSSVQYKRKPKPLPKPMISKTSIPNLNDELLNELSKSISKKVGLLKSKDRQFVETNDTSLDIVDSNMDIGKKDPIRKLSDIALYANTFMNLPDDEKAKKNDPASEVIYMPMDKHSYTASYVEMNEHENEKRKHVFLNTQAISSAADYDNIKYVNKFDLVGINQYVCMDHRKLHQMRRSIPDNLSKHCESIHTKGDCVCIYEPLDYMYIYELSPDALQKNSHPFIRRKEKANSIPCLCSGHDGIAPKIKARKKIKNELDKSQLLFYSAEDIYVDFNKKETPKSDLKNTDKSHEESKLADVVKNDNVSNHTTMTSEDFLSFKPFNTVVSGNSRKLTVFKKKVEQIKNLFTDWE